MLLFIGCDVNDIEKWYIISFNDVMNCMWRTSINPIGRCNLCHGLFVCLSNAECCAHGNDMYSPRILTKIISWITVMGSEWLLRPGEVRLNSINGFKIQRWQIREWLAISMHSVVSINQLFLWQNPFSSHSAEMQPRRRSVACVGTIASTIELPLNLARALLAIHLGIYFTIFLTD